jgi:hypothetical protein
MTCVPSIAELFQLDGESAAVTGANWAARCSRAQRGAATFV